MKITVDLRSLHTNQYSGVEMYTVKVLEQLLELDSSNLYTLFYNGYEKKSFDRFHFINVNYKQTRIPNKILNFLMTFIGRPKIEDLAEEPDSPLARATTLFMPNWNTVALKLETKLILTVHDVSALVRPELYGLKSRLWHLYIRIKTLLHRADHLIAVSEFTKNELVNVLGLPESKITVAPLGVDHDLYHQNYSLDVLRDTRNRYDLPGDFALFVGTIEPRKNLENIIDAFNNVESDMSLVIAGKLGWKYNNILRKIEASPRRRFIKILGYIPEEDKPLLMKLARVFVWPSLYEGFGLPVLEAMAVGTPVVTSKVSSLPELAGGSSILVDPNNIDDIAKAIDILHTSEAVREKYIAAGLERAKQYNWRQTAEKIQPLFRDNYANRF